MCLTQDGLPFSHLEQVQRLCHAGARWIQLRHENAPHDEWLRTARTAVITCKAHDVVCIINDSVDVALGLVRTECTLVSNDEDWAEARRRMGRRACSAGR